MYHDNSSVRSFTLEDFASILTHPLEAEAWRSHFILSETSQMELRGIQDKIHEALARQRLEIMHVRATLSRLLEEENHLISRLVKLHSRGLSRSCFQKYSHTVDFPLSLPPREPDGVVNFALTAVCSLWRQVAISTKALWGDVSISYSFEDSGIRLPSICELNFKFMKIVPPHPLGYFLCAILSAWGTIGKINTAGNIIA